MKNVYFSLLKKHMNSNLTIGQVFCTIYGIGKSQAFKICCDLGYNFNLKFCYIDEILYNSILNIFDIYLNTNNLYYNILSLKSKKLYMFNHILLLKNIKHIRYFRLKNGLPVSGQRTHSNGRTSKLKLNFNE